MAQSTVHRNTTATEPIRRRKFMILSGEPLRLGDNRAPNTTTNSSSGQQYQDTNITILRKYWDLLGSTWFMLKGSSYGPHEDNCFVFIKPDIKPKSPPHFHETEDVRVSAEFCRSNLLPPNLSAKVLKKGYREPLLHARSKQQILRTTTIPEQRLDGPKGENGGTSIGDAFGRQTIARWKCSGGKSKE